MKGLEPPSLTALDPKSSASTIPPHPQFMNHLQLIHLSCIRLGEDIVNRLINQAKGLKKNAICCHRKLYQM